ncbi:MAG: S1 RNA-binding domain-containing protein [Clostridia bacterium]|jgi:S1 RNA binding domain protein
MLVEVGNVVEGKVSGITSFGAFVQLPEGKSGLVHISEVADEYVRDINEHLKENQVVKVKVISLVNKGKISLSIKQANVQGAAEEPNGNASGQMLTEKPDVQGNFQRAEAENSTRQSDGSRPFGRSAPRKNADKGKKAIDVNTFDGKLAKYLKDSEEKMHDLKKSVESKRGSGGYRKTAHF